jgi:hypothetical protein
MVCHSPARCTGPVDSAILSSGFRRIELRRLLHRFELRLAVMAVLALLIAQLGATAHAYAHHVADRGASARHAGTIAHNPCSDCLAYAPLLSAAGTPTALPLIGRQPTGAARHPAPASLVEPAPALAFRSRAPPYAA